MQYESGKRTFPGYVNALYQGQDNANAANKMYVDATWVVMILPQLDRNDLYQRWVDQNYTNAQRTSFLRFAYCPSDPAPTLTGTPLAYVINCGNDDNVYDSTASPAQTHYNSRACGVAFNQSKAYTVPPPPATNTGVAANALSVNLDYISSHDGAENTLLVTENVLIDPQRLWVPTNPTLVANTGFQWACGTAPGASYPTAPGNQALFWTPSAAAGQRVCSINKDLEVTHPRPSSRHPGGVVASYCDGHSGFLTEAVDYLVVQHLMTPFGQQAGKTLATAGVDGSTYGIPKYDTTIGNTANLANDLFGGLP
jgi:prepilin-type processing-associated H-X9-DG protein